MNHFWYRIISFVLVFILLILGLIFLTSYIVKSRDFKIYETDSNTLVMGENTHYDILLSGASHARNLSRYRNHIRIERILDKSVTNIAQGAATCGVNEQYFYLKYFYEQGNSVDQLVYLLSPPLLYSDQLPVASNTFNQEFFSFDFLWSYIQFDSENKRQRIFEYIRSKLTLEWICTRPVAKSIRDDVLEEVEPDIVNEILSMYYNPENSEQRFKVSCATIEEEIRFAAKHDTEVVFIIPPAVFGKWPGHFEVIDFAREMKEKYSIRYYDLSESITDKKFYYDHHHLNTFGVVKFMKDFMKPFLENKYE